MTHSPLFVGKYPPTALHTPIVNVSHIVSTVPVSQLGFEVTTQSLRAHDPLPDGSTTAVLVKPAGHASAVAASNATSVQPVGAVSEHGPGHASALGCPASVGDGPSTGCVASLRAASARPALRPFASRPDASWPVRAAPSDTEASAGPAPSGTGPASAAV